MAPGAEAEAVVGGPASSNVGARDGGGIRSSSTSSSTERLSLVPPMLRGGESGGGGRSALRRDEGEGRASLCGGGAARGSLRWYAMTAASGGALDMPRLRTEGATGTGERCDERTRPCASPGESEACRAAWRSAFSASRPTRSLGSSASSCARSSRESGRTRA